MKDMNIDLGLTFVTNDGQTVAIFHKDLTGDVIPGTWLLDKRFWGRSTRDPRLFIEYDREGRALEFWRAPLPEGVTVTKPHPAIRRLPENERKPAPEAFSLKRPNNRREAQKEAWHRFMADPKNREKKRAADRARYQARRAAQKQKKESK